MNLNLLHHPPPPPFRTRPLTPPISSIPSKQPPPSLTSQIRIEDRRRYTDSSGSPTEKMAHVERQSFDHIGDLAVCRDSAVRFGEDFVEQDEIVGRTGGALECVVGLEEEVPFAGFGDAAIHEPGC